ncbi:MAG: hypothetical protein AB1324_01265 [Candidatus Micrarchaeota archaeon]
MDRRWMGFLGWGLALWLLGYALGIAFFFLLPPSIFGWAVMLIATPVTVFVALKKIEARSVREYLPVALLWTAMAVILDYIFIVILLGSPDYYKPDVLVYYALTFLIPIASGFWKSRRT